VNPQSSPGDADPRMQRIVEAFETLSPQSLPALGTIYAPDAVFKDPFNEVRGVAAITAIFEHMFRSLEAPRFIVHSAVVQGREGFLTWDMRFRMKRGAPGEQVIRGATHLVFDDAGRIAVHRDYWDAAEELYEKLPLLGALMRWLKRRVNS
jgi:ketosteroid isomerase-like protein